MTRRWFAEDHPTSPHLWDEDKEVVGWLESQVEEDARCTVQDSIKLIRKEAMMHSVKDIGPELAGDLIMYLAEKLSPEKRDEMTKAIGDLGEVREGMVKARKQYWSFIGKTKFQNKTAYENFCCEVRKIFS